MLSNKLMLVKESIMHLSINQKNGIKNYNK